MKETYEIVLCHEGQYMIYGKTEETQDWFALQGYTEHELERIQVRDLVTAERTIFADLFTVYPTYTIIGPLSPNPLDEKKPQL